MPEKAQLIPGAGTGGNASTLISFGAALLRGVESATRSAVLTKKKKRRKGASGKPKTPPNPAKKIKKIRTGRSSRAPEAYG